MLRLVFFIGIVWGCLGSLYAENQDSIIVERWLHEAADLPSDSCRIMHFAKKFLGVPYVAGTLDENEKECLTVHLDKVDCTTYVELVMALVVADKQSSRSYQSFKNALLKIRYRDGVLQGYSSRLHYFSDWIWNNEKKGLVKECTSDLEYCIKHVLYLNFMSAHVDAYPQLKADSSLVEEIKLFEAQWQGVEVYYIPKRFLASSNIGIKDGDILAITTSIQGLDVVHVGFACWKEGRLHMLHASSNAGKVIEEPKSLYEYSYKKKAHTGVRAIRVID